jgi:dihydroxy-acid dehydratase
LIQKEISDSIFIKIFEAGGRSMAIQQRAKPFRENWLQIDTLRCGMDWSEEDLERPQILIDDVFGHSHPGSFHLDSLSREASKGVYQKGGKPSSLP